MSNFNELVAPDWIFHDIAISNKKALFAFIAEKAATLSGEDAESLKAQLLEREALGSTGFGGGIAIPHADVRGLQSPQGMFIRLAEPIDYDSVDGLPVDCVFALLSPPSNEAVHLRTLAKVSRQLRERALVEKLRGARSAEALYALMADFEAADAA